ncbi:pyrimidine dimer DNA glycosylase/endonuclease V [Candidatus Woesearchaeota archaeon]|nr:pyrimidine dimer DNA glycosylase/endonuclease V [Candidatus Woesearchaeota archaeon]
MRLWSIHPKYLDAKGLVALWREALLAQRVLEGKTTGYKNHPQLERFKQAAQPMDTIGGYLHAVLDESLERGYKFSGEKILGQQETPKIQITKGQLDFEFEYLKQKLAQRDKNILDNVKTVTKPIANPIFAVVEGPKAKWEKSLL